ncbi:phenylalanine--tRNA ligase subunit beta [Maridesulfovibrio hydrothermalis]|uniref:Phenylalanine--tRNA ligase beta subunit n=1 Tax=Maridesulfovibrio hydrothermalis AM13 = DSM 14728 TaxID=1121451 RepID=L0RHT1_9BACT|nr:phenylalanine--tRNA ligase subunit beta [Maridesulfovibrio hydrothermalis]CCO25146.1 Phenylalanine--tRNA ligase beta subunit [Maridesulfovibrio hydrothermalis AM13 = DSM 14728]
MLLSMQWLRDFVPYEGEIQELGDRLTMLGLELEEIFNPFEAITALVVGHIVECEQHPEADKLSVCSVDVGEEELLTIVCGAPNVAKGQNVPVAKVGTIMPGGMKIKKAKLRGVKSLGMICSERELELSDAHEGIMVLPQDLKPGQNFVEAMNMETTVLDLGVTPNRADCLSMLGIAREAALAFDLPLNMPSLNLIESGGNAADMLKINIDDPEFCPLYQARILEGAKIAPSPDWMRYRLLSVGVRPINNIVDVTNYILFELGQPLHAFDKDLLKGDSIRVGFSPEGTKFSTLDEQERTLLDSDLLIWDAERPVALAGVMGGMNSEINDNSTNVVLESAVFRPGTIRKTARRLSLPSEASYRFERGVDQQMNSFAMDRAAQLMSELSGAKIISGVAKNEPKPWVNRTHTYRHARCNSWLGLNLEPEFSKKAFTLMGLNVDDSNADSWKVSTPSYRLDLEREADLYEEVARYFGMDKIPSVLPRISKTFDASIIADTPYGFYRRIKNWGRGAGLHEAINYSFVGDDDLDLLGLPKEGRVNIANPLSEDQNVMRTELAPGLLNTVRHNLAQGNNHIRIFEIAKKFIEDPSSDTNTREQTRLGIMLSGARNASEWPLEQGDADYLDVKGLVEHLISDLKLDKAEFTLTEENSYLEPCVKITCAGDEIGFMGMIKADIADKYHAKKEVWMADLNADLLREKVMAHKIKFAPLPVYPPSRRDVTVIAAVSLQAETIKQAILGLKLPLLESVELVTVFTPEGQDEERNISYRLTYRHAQKTLTDKVVDKEHKKVLAALEKALPVRF